MVAIQRFEFTRTEESVEKLSRANTTFLRFSPSRQILQSLLTSLNLNDVLFKIQFANTPKAKRPKSAAPQKPNHSNQISSLDS